MSHILHLRVKFRNKANVFLTSVVFEHLVLKLSDILNVDPFAKVVREKCINRNELAAENAFNQNNARQQIPDPSRSD